ncbi:tripartite tricarboxylate transporter substrate binding protein [Bordetella sp. BOR01]|uniref:Bug family tripartite tricarboxylate transporter substrate binding protein n=1 Tax=Bordetella sp. BOR01 TaxID=2854779 RepID=UPI001C4710AD|nr:tripartite tricarboxylate transporter substrate binding protein [Bordetella sp. BOR01]MBV7485517.1 tripartite tricarboxylate transporter substrate binding protein [Bordetella sp. BOR01]
MWSQAGTFPDRAVTMVVPYPAGGSLDTVGRPLTQMFEQETGQSLILENVGGAGGLIAAAKVVQAKPDGNTLLLASNGQVTIAPLMYKDMAYDPQTDLLPIAHLVDQTAVLYASTKSPYRTFDDVAKAAQSGSGRLQFASSGTGSISHLAQELLAQQMGVQFTHVPYRGAAPALQDVAGGQVPLLFTFVGSAKAMTASGMVRPLAVAAAERLPALPDVPTFAELGYPGVQASVWIGLMAPKGTAPDRIERLATVFNHLLQQPGFKKLMTDNNMEVKGGSVAQFTTMMAEDGKRWADLAKAVNLAAN